MTLTASTSSAISSACSRSAAGDVVAAGPAQGDAVGDLQAGRLARLLHGPDDLAGQAGTTQLVVELEVEGHRLALVVDDRPALARAFGDDDVVGADLDRPCRRRSTVAEPSALSDAASAAASAAAMAPATFGVSVPKRLPRLRKLPLARVVDEIGAGVRRTDSSDADVELLAHLGPQVVAQRATRRPSATRARRSGWRVLTFALGAGRAAQLDEAAGESPSGSGRESSTPGGVDLRPASQVHRVGQLRRGRARRGPATPAR